MLHCAALLHRAGSMPLARTYNGLLGNLVATTRSSTVQGGDDDVDALLAQFALEEKSSNTADIRQDVAPPAARVYASFTAHPTSVSDSANVHDWCVLSDQACNWTAPAPASCHDDSCKHLNSVTPRTSH